MEEKKKIRKWLAFTIFGTVLFLFLTIVQFSIGNIKFGLIGILITLAYIYSFIINIKKNKALKEKKE